MLLTVVARCCVVCDAVPAGIGDPLPVGLNDSTILISWAAPTLPNGPPPNYTLSRMDVSFNTPPPATTPGVRFTGAGYVLFPSDTIPTGVQFTG